MYSIGSRVELHPATETWMRGERYGEVTRVLTNNKVAVKLDKTGRIVRISADLIQGEI